MSEWFIVCVCMHPCVYVCVCAWASYLANFQMGMQPRLLNQHKTATVQEIWGRCGGVVFPSERQLWNKEQDSPCSLCITLAMSKRLGEAMLSRRSITDRLMQAARRTFTTVLCGTSPLPLLPSCLLLSLSLYRSNLTAGPGPIESQVSCRDKMLDCPIEVTFPFVVCKRQIARQLGIAANLIKLTFCCTALLFILLLFGLSLTLNLHKQTIPISLTLKGTFESGDLDTDYFII